jgi:hypothetical protein
LNYPVYTGMRSAGPQFLQWISFVLVLLALPLFALADWSLAGWALGAGLFAVNRASAVLLDRFARGKMEVTAVGITGMGFISRGWITFGILVAWAEFVSKPAAIAAAISFLVYFTIDLLIRSLAWVAGGATRKPDLGGPA